MRGRPRCGGGTAHQAAASTSTGHQHFLLTSTSRALPSFLGRPDVRALHYRRYRRSLPRGPLTELFPLYGAPHPPPCVKSAGLQADLVSDVSLRARQTEMACSLLNPISTFALLSPGLDSRILQICMILLGVLSKALGFAP
jgi:hypothetical protein